MKEILFVLPKLGGGGAEKVVLTLLNNLDRKKFKPHLVIFDDSGNYMSNLSPDVIVKVIKTRFNMKKYFDILFYIRKLNPDIVFSTMRTTSTILSILKIFFPKKSKLIIRENNTPSVSIQESRFTFIWGYIYRKILKKSKIIICQSNFMKKDFIDNFSYSGDNLVKIYNPVDIVAIEKILKDSDSPYSSKYKNIVFVGKMTKQKGIDILLNSFAEFTSPDSSLRLWLLGNGIMADKYKELANNLGIGKRVKFIGEVNNPYKWIKYADLFVLPSRYEGLPNVVLEAIVCNCPIVTSDHPGGTKEIMSIINQPNRVVDKFTWEKNWFEKQIVDTKSFYREFEVKNVIKKYEKIFGSKL